MRSATLNTGVAALLATAVLTVTACSSREKEVPLDPATVAGPHIESVSQVVVTLDPSMPADRAERYAQESGEHWIQKAITDALSAAGRLDPDSDVVLEVNVIGFRLRSTAANVWVGTMAGSDSVDLEVTAREGDDDLKSFTVHRSSIKGGLMMPAAGTRLRKICAVLAADIVRVL